MPLTPKLLAALVLVAVAFIVAAVLGGSGGSKSASQSAGPAPAPAPATAGSAPETPASQTSEQLGYPAFATNNTTRIGASDPASNAAAVALAVFPSTDPSQRPKAVTLVGEEDWQGAIAAAVLMAAPVRAPLLISNPDGVPDPTSEALGALDPQGAPATGGAAAFAIGDVGVPSGTKATKVAAGPGAAEAAAIAKLRDRLFDSAPAHILIAPSTDPEIAIPAAAWAARSGDPVLFADSDELPAVTETALKRHTGLPIFVLGPSSAISSDVLRKIAKVDPRVKRISGENPVANAIAFARYGDGDFGWNVNDPGHGFVLARSDSPIDAAVAAPLSGSGTWGPLLLTDSAAKVPAELRSYFLDVKPGYTTNPTRAFYNHVWVIGDQEAIDVNQQAEVNGLAELAKIGGEQ
jgi:ell wall binding domain 2 (CWB2)